MSSRLDYPHTVLNIRGRLIFGFEVNLDTYENVTFYHKIHIKGKKMKVSETSLLAAVS